jgi:hypothetical protein
MLGLKVSGSLQKSLRAAVAVVRHCTATAEHPQQAACKQPWIGNQNEAVPAHSNFQHSKHSSDVQLLHTVRGAQSMQQHHHTHVLDVTRRKHRPFGEPMTGSLGRSNTKSTKNQEKTGPSALPKLILQIIPDWISKRLLMVFINQVNQLRHSSLVRCI